MLNKHSSYSSFPLYNIDLTIGNTFQSPFGEIYMDKDHFLILPTFISNSSFKIINKEIIKVQSSYSYMYDVMEMILNANQILICDFKQYNPINYKNIKYIIIVCDDYEDEKILYRSFYSVASIENKKNIENNNPILFYRNVNDINYYMYSEQLVNYIITYLHYENRKRIVTLNHGKVYLFNINTFEGSVCSPNIINV